WSIGPYEYDNTPFPQIIYVSEPTNGGDDGHPLGTRQAPFASLARAYDIARDPPPALPNGPRADVMEIRIAEGSYDMETPNMPDIDTGPDIHILGGYDKTSWARNSKTIITELFRNTATDVFTYSGGAITGGSLLEGFTLKSNFATGTTRSLVIQAGAQPEIRNNILIGGDSDISIPILVMNSGPHIIGNTFIGGTANPVGQSFGIFLQDSGGTEVKNNDIHGGTAVTTAGIFCDNSPVLITNNRIDAGTGTTTSYGLSIQNTNGSTINGNHIYGGEGSNISYGVNFQDNFNTSLINNVIHGGSASTQDSLGVEIQGGDVSVVLANNTIYGGQGNNFTFGIRTGGTAHPAMINNIIIAGDSPAGTDYSFFEGGTLPPENFFHNLLLAGPGVSATPYRSSTRGTFNHTVAALEADLNANGSTAAGNMIDEDDPPVSYFINFNNFIPGINYDEFINAENWQLNGGGRENAAQGGQDIPGLVDFDRDGKPRTGPWSIGAYEY
ncbi:MAG: hypothetical protein DRZ90_17255, partial [Spirochaetes bacterium]